MLTKDSLRSQFAKEWEKHYKTKALEESGFSRRKCSKCGRAFWSTEERELCGDASCTGYTFIGNAPSKRKLGYVETWKEIEKYFTAHGHGSIKSYPSVARWRDDLYFTIASINGFQPYVVNGELEAQCNPLIIPQVCIRFSDIANVGVTGRHYSNFVMVGQHAFNTKKTGLFYWKDEALRHDIAYLKALGIPTKELIFQEDVWMGGGNYGPCIEYFSGGLELGNCVFMQYEILPDGGSRELSTKTIDMGAGLARLCWITHGTPDSYSMVFGKMVPKYRKKFGVKVDDKLYLEFAKRVGGLDVEDVKDPEAEVRRIEEEIGHPGFEKTLAPLQGLYASLDHLLTLLFTVKDGMLPSNAGGGYNLRMVLRRTFGIAEEFGWEMDYAGVLEDHVKELKGLFPELADGVESTSDVIAEERKKYTATKEGASGKVVNMLNKGEIREPALVMLYESHGIPPEMVADIAREKGADVEVPMNFYEKVRHREEGERKLGNAGQIDVEGIPKTKELWYSKESGFRAKVLKVVEGKSLVRPAAVILDQTAFYPEGGGQVGDNGELGGVKVLNTIKQAGVALHLVEDAGKFKEGATVEGKVNLERRKRVSKHHTAAHLLNAACREILGTHIWQGGSGKKEDEAHLDVTHYKRISDEELNAIERKVNDYIMRDLRIEVEVLQRNTAEQKYGFSLYQGGAVPGKELRVVKIEDGGKLIDAEACGGTHQMNSTTGEIGYFKIVKRESVQDGVERIYYKVGEAAVAYAQGREALLKKAAGVISVSEQQLPQAVERFFEEWKSQRKEIEKLKEEFIGARAEEIAEKSAKEGVVEEKIGEDAKVLAKIGALVSESAGAMVILTNPEGNFVCAAGKGAKKNALQLFEELKKRGAKGGGNEKMVSGKMV
ncbi:MAG: alanine--tRNA ligase [Candidatus Micrarchaeota archaeon]|nr:alanine--tRNA ligase [Candidatus Micrarchaeota archaeon]